MKIPDIPEAVKKTFEKNRKTFPCRVIRASAIGYFMPELNGCQRRGVLTQTNWKDQEPWSAESLIRFEEGNLQEKAVMRALENAGIEPIEQQMSFEWPEYNLSGHIDCTILVDGKALPLEVKSAAPSIFAQISDFESLNKKPWLRAYKAQITLYMLFKNIDKGIMLFKDKSSGLMKQINVDLDYELGEAALKTAEIINQNIKDGSRPPRIKDIDVCSECPFKSLCCPDVRFGAELRIEDDPDYEAKIDRYLELKDAKKECDDLYKNQIQPKMKASSDNGHLNLVVGKYRLTGKTDTRGSLRCKIEVI